MTRDATSWGRRRLNWLLLLLAGAVVVAAGATQTGWPPWAGVQYRVEDKAAQPVAYNDPGWWRCYLRFMDTGPLTFQRDEQLVFLMWLPEPGDPRSAFIRNGRVDIPVEYALSPDAASITIGFANRNSQITAEFHPDGILDGKPYQYLSGAWRWSDGQGVIQVMQFGAEQPSSGHDNMPYSIRGELTRPPGLVNYGRSRSIADSNGEWEFRYEQSGVALAEIRHEQWDHIIMRNVFADVSVPGDSERAFAGYSCGRGIGLDYFDGEYAYAIRGLFSEDGVATGWTQKPTQIVGTLHRWNRSHEKLVAIRIGDISDE